MEILGHRSGYFPLCRIKVFIYDTFTEDKLGQLESLAGLLGNHQNLYILELTSLLRIYDYKF